jgi:hypothetical protein
MLRSRSVEIAITVAKRVIKFPKRVIKFARNE